MPSLNVNTATTAALVGLVANMSKYKKLRAEGAPDGRALVAKRKGLGIFSSKNEKRDQACRLVVQVLESNPLLAGHVDALLDEAGITRDRNIGKEQGAKLARAVAARYLTVAKDAMRAGDDLAASRAVGALEGLRKELADPGVVRSTIQAAMPAALINHQIDRLDREIQASSQRPFEMAWATVDEAGRITGWRPFDPHAFSEALAELERENNAGEENLFRDDARKNHFDLREFEDDGPKVALSIFVVNRVRNIDVLERCFDVMLALLPDHVKGQGAPKVEGLRQIQHAIYTFAESDKSRQACGGQRLDALKDKIAGRINDYQSTLLRNANADDLAAKRKNKFEVFKGGCDLA